MKTNEEKLKQLLTIVVKNGFDIDALPGYFNKWLHNTQSVIIDSELCIIIFGAVKNGFYYSLNDLVTNFKEGEVSFIDALSIASKDFEITSCAKYPMSVRQQWILQPTSKRLDWLFETFNHLLNEK